MIFGDRTLVCSECGAGFVFPAVDQRRQAMVGVQDEPRRCPACRSNRRTAEPRGLPRSRRGTGRIGTRELFPAVCAACGRETRLPFKPRGDRPPYCNDCFGKRR